MRTSTFSYNGKKLHELESEELLDCVEAMWSEKNAKIAALEATLKMYELMINTFYMGAGCRECLICNLG